MRSKKKNPISKEAWANRFRILDLIRKFRSSNLNMNPSEITQFKLLYKTKRVHRIYSYEIESKFDMTGEEVREVIKHWRRNGELIAPSGNGYFYAETKEEALRGLENLEGRHNSLGVTIQCYKNAIKDRFGEPGQMGMPL